MADYFDSKDFASVGRTYDWASLHIDLSVDKNEIDLDAVLSSARPFGDSPNETVFIHEYVHYLQSFYTTWGALMFCEYRLALEKINASNLEEQFKLPLKLEAKEGMELWNAGVKQYEKFFGMLGSDRGNIDFERLNAYPNYSVKEFSDHSLTINNGLVSYTIDNKTVREHMAELSSLLFLNYSDEQVHSRIINCNDFCSSLGNLDKKPMYWMLFEYFYFHGYINIAEGLVLLCNGAMSSLMPHWSINRFFKFLKNNKAAGAGKDLLTLVRQFSSSDQELNIIRGSFETVIEELNKQLRLCEKHSSTHDLYRLSLNIFNFLKNNLNTYQSADVFFREPSNLRRKKFWSDTISKTGTPIIRYKDKTPVITTFDRNLIEPLTYFLGITKVLDNLQDTKIFACPFHSDFNICKAAYKNDDTCFHEPLSVKNPEQDGKECHYQNAVLLLGLKDRLL